ncbi:MAG: divalent-cation tolerance protein CutA [Candidatus Thermoplasmatota archaeon]
MESEDECVVALVTAGSMPEADLIADELMGTGLAACVNIVQIESIYRWKGAVERGGEYLLVCKTHLECIEALEARVKEMHSYEVPEILVLPILGGSREYLSWLKEALSEPR